MPTWDQTADMEEGGLTDFSATSGAVSATTGSKRNGSYGMNAAISTTTAMGRMDVVAETKMTVEAWFDPNTFSGNANDEFQIVSLWDAVSKNEAIVFARKDASGYSLVVKGFVDAGTGSLGSY